MIAAKAPPKCQVPSIPMFTLPLYLGGKSSSTAVKIAVNYPPTLIPVKNLPITKNIIDPELIEKIIPVAYISKVIMKTFFLPIIYAKTPNIRLPLIQPI